ncbi:DUF4440 domain-containing protein [Sphingomonas sp. LHG3406-1]|uniref:DUF4440 domain-containing protein n=1 Tax=Sphingomonas sp. LHG3406-1 TaxID=2804617 RepID=UPI00260E6189|nr:DUF4440 domain-containing protein [Sphingomonas sp. LHG3406-1]
MGTDTNARTEALEHQLMRAWLEGDRKAMKGLLASRFRMVVGAKPPVLLDRKSLLEAAGTRWRIGGYRFGTSIYSRQLGATALFAAEIELQGSIEGVDVSGSWWLSDHWSRSSLTRRWQLIDRQLSRLDERPAFPDAVRSLQLWR